MKIRSIFLIGLSAFISQQALAQTNGGTVMTVLSNGNIGLQECQQNGSCQVIGNPNGYSSGEIQSMSNHNGLYGEIEGPLYVAGMIASTGVAVCIAVPFAIGQTGVAAAVTFLGISSLGEIIPFAVDEALESTVHALNPDYQIKTGSLKTVMKTSLASLKKPGDSVYIAVESNSSGMKRDQSIATDIVKRLPENAVTSPAGAVVASTASVAK